MAISGVEMPPRWRPVASELLSSSILFGGVHDGNFLMLRRRYGMLVSYSARHGLNWPPTVMCGARRCVSATLRSAAQSGSPSARVRNYPRLFYCGAGPIRTTLLCSEIPTYSIHSTFRSHVDVVLSTHSLTQYTVLYKL